MEITQGDESVKLTCCYIPEDQQGTVKNHIATHGRAAPLPGIGCQKDAEWEIWHGNGPDDNTVACTEHVGEMLTDAPEHRIYPVEK